MSAVRSQRGSAMVVALGMAALLLPLGAFVALQARMDLLVQRNLRAETEAFYVAEAGLEHAVAEMKPGTSFDASLAGPDGRLGTADDGMFPFAEGPPVPFPAAPFAYVVRVSRRGGAALDLTSSGSGRNGASKVIVATVLRSPQPFTPAALYIGDAASLDLDTTDFLLSGFDHRLNDPAAARRGGAAAVAGLAISREETEAWLRLRLTQESAAQVIGAGDSPSLSVASEIDLQPILAACAQHPAHVTVPANASNLTLGSTAMPQIAIAASDLDVTGELTGTGILVVRGALHVSGTFTFTGLVLALGGVVFEPSSTVQIVGACWRASSTDPRLRLGGHGAIVYSSAALAVVDTAFPGLLPHAAVLAGWHELA